MTIAKDDGKQNLTIRLDRQTIRRAKILAARRSTSVSDLIARQIEILAGGEEAYKRAERQAMSLLDQGFHLGGARLELAEVNCIGDNTFRETRALLARS